MKLTFLGTGEARQVPVYGCSCKACQRARLISSYIRRPASALIEDDDTTLLVDAGITDLSQRFNPGQLSAILITDFLPHRAQGLFHFRWGLNDSIPVYVPPACNVPRVLSEQPGILNFQENLQAFRHFRIGPFEITALPLQQNRSVFGYCIQTNSTKLAYVPSLRHASEKVTDFLKQWAPTVLIMDCTNSETKSDRQCEHDFSNIITAVRTIKPETTYLTHISHDMDCYLIEHFYHLPLKVNIAVDHLVIRMDEMIAARQSAST